jgi:glycosyltransferase involved in cell wall biosynthesis
LLHARVRKVFEDIETAFELIFVDDGGGFRTWEIIREIADADRSVSGLRLSRNFGQHPAIMAGIRASHGDAVLVMD